MTLFYSRPLWHLHHGHRPFLHYYTGDAAGQCPVHEFYISFNMILCVAISIISVLPVVQEHMPKSGLLQSGVISLYIIYLTWSAMGNSPYMVKIPFRF